MNEYSHQTITEWVLRNNFNSKLNYQVQDNILKGVILPDKDENQNGYAYHFYNPLTNANYLGNELHAKAKCIYHFAKFCENRDYIELGRAIHFLEDICTPVHTQYEDTSDSILKFKLHLDFEKELDKYTDRMTFPIDFPEFEDIVNEIYSYVSLSDFIDESCYKSVELYYKYKNNDKGLKSDAICETYENAYYVVTNFIHNYVLDGLTKKINVINNLKNKPVGTIINTFQDGVIKYSDIAPLTQDFKVRINNNYNSVPSVLVFKKGGTLKNYVLENIFDILKEGLD